MLTPQEVAEHAFQKASFGGYNMAMVDEFLDLLTADYTTLYKENAALKAKMKVLADKIEEYRSTEDAMRKALLSAQRVADQMVADAEEQKAKLLADAEREAKEQIEALRREAETEQYRLTAAQNATAAYIAKLKELHENQIQYLGSLSKLTPPAAESDPVAQTAAAINDAVEKTMEEELPEDEPTQGESLYETLRQGAAVKDESVSEGEDDTAPTRRIDFSDLKFGKDYQAEE